MNIYIKLDTSDDAILSDDADQEYDHKESIQAFVSQVCKAVKKDNPSSRVTVEADSDAYSTRIWIDDLELSHDMAEYVALNELISDVWQSWEWLVES